MDPWCNTYIHIHYNIVNNACSNIALYVRTYGYLNCTYLTLMQCVPFLPVSTVSYSNSKSIHTNHTDIYMYVRMYVHTIVLRTVAIHS